CSPAAQRAYEAVAGRLNLYPDPRATPLREAVARRHGLEPERLLFGIGSDEIFGLVCQTFCQPGDNVVQFEFGFFAYRIAGRAAGAEVRFAPESDLRRSVDCLLAEVDERTRVVFLDNPGNPNGAWIPGEELRRLHAALPPQVILLLDGAYAEFLSDPDYEDGIALAREAANVMFTRTFSKIHGLAALRVGWAYGPQAIIGAMDRIRAPFNTSIPGQLACAEALFDDDFQRRSVELVERWRPWLNQQIGGLGFEVYPSAANFVLVRFPDRPGRTAAEVEAHLAARGVLVRGLANYGLPDFLRITVGTEAQNRALMAAMEDLPG
ncbi:MAG: aminotransferase class I/II-fold pyridoxal phosphate-dependent enzyme, partial [Pseudomonadota bacterium]|nr:aminotransferase class I/II-fold pyridoxal phosphate-dependent enzyme [Pseudomonadota bacterium]